MDFLDTALAARSSRRRLLGGAALGAAGTIVPPAMAQSIADRGPSRGPAEPMTSAFPGKARMILRRVRPPLLETPMSVFDKDVFTPNDQFFVRWHWADMPSSIDVESFRLNVVGHVNKPLSLSLANLLKLRRVELAAVNQCSGNSRSLFQPRVAGAQWGNGAMGNAKWLGVRLRDILELAGVKAGAVQVRFGGLDQAAVPDGPDFLKALDIDHARNGEVMVAFGMNGEQLPILNGFPCRLIVPGWYSTYWVKMLNSIEVLPAADDQYWMSKAYKIPSTPGADVPPGTKDFPTLPINRMIPRSWVTSQADGQKVALAPTIAVGGIAMGGDCGVARVDVSPDGGRTWHPASLGPDHGNYSFRRWDGRIPLARGANPIMVRCLNTKGVAQSLKPIWNPGGYMRGQIETTTLIAG